MRTLERRPLCSFECSQGAVSVMWIAWRDECVETVSAWLCVPARVFHQIVCVCLSERARSEVGVNCEGRNCAHVGAACEMRTCNLYGDRRRVGCMAMVQEMERCNGDVYDNV